MKLCAHDVHREHVDQECEDARRTADRSAHGPPLVTLATSVLGRLLLQVLLED